METTLKPSVQISENRTRTFESTNSVSWYNQFIEKLSFSYFGLIAMTISIGSIMGGLAAMKIFENNAPIWQLALVMAGAMANNVSAIGQAPTKWVVNLFLFSTGVSTLLFIINL